MSYEIIIKQLESITENVKDTISNMANAASILYNSLEEINWSGFYILKGDKLMLGPFMGQPACVEIPVGKGVCGTSAERRETILVPDVHEFPGHIACDAASKSEIVIPIIVNEKLIGVLDIDSPIVNRFSLEDKEGLEAFAEVLADAIKDSE